MPDLDRHSRADHRPVLPLRAAVRRATTSWCRRRPPGAVRLHGYVYDGAGDAGAGRADRDPAGRRARRGARPSRDRCAGTAPRSPAGAARHRPDRPLLVQHRRAGPGGAFFAVTVFARGLLDRLFTRAYLPGRDVAGGPVAGRPRPGRRETLVAVREADGSLRFDIHLQGDRETVFLTFTAGRRDERLLSPGSHRARRRRRRRALVAAMLRVEVAWLRALADVGASTPKTSTRWPRCRRVAVDPRWTPRGRGRRQPGAAAGRARFARAWATPRRRLVHRGLTSQDVLDTALMLLAREALARTCGGPGRDGAGARRARPTSTGPA